LFFPPPSVSASRVLHTEECAVTLKRNKQNNNSDILTTTGNPTQAARGLLTSSAGEPETSEKGQPESRQTQTQTSGTKPIEENGPRTQ
jgi:hypothetical protein